ncbi:hypothetical protein DTO164E3_5630 [Paecilomyces variotii]|nr:hypothetical protein DTO164E3_5630 [Paecilomyces variotii]KAJ9198230.1 hypothetical protein DTO032I3_5646 [Paecilomyces variotii]KAJ9274880.1 hypothetical protein DTO021D3_8238 [Paecilomyces variotii]KAJ9344680.1 hypothetical protein DTO027B6_2862 [Paecilomyces variotii]KAJ9347666.1 hypothetical protein DTO027B9_8998 [Paecilomyces variotii]
MMQRAFICDIAVNGDEMCGALICDQPALRRHIRQLHPGAIENPTQKNVTQKEEIAGHKFVTASVLHMHANHLASALKKWVLTGGWREAR